MLAFPSSPTSTPSQLSWWSWVSRSLVDLRLTLTDLTTENPPMTKTMGNVFQGQSAKEDFIRKKVRSVFNPRSWKAKWNDFITEWMKLRQIPRMVHDRLLCMHVFMICNDCICNRFFSSFWACDLSSTVHNKAVKLKLYIPERHSVYKTSYLNVLSKQF